MSQRARIMALLIVLPTLAACAPQQPPSSQSAPGQTRQAVAPRGPTSITIGITSPVLAMGIAGSGSTAGGWVALEEIYSNGLVTDDASSPKLVGRLAEKVPSLQDNSIQLLPDGRMRLVFPLRKSVTWHDGAPFTAHDMVLSFQMAQDPAFLYTRTLIDQIDSVEAQDDHTLLVTYKQPYYQATALTGRNFWPAPRHLLQEPLEKYQQSKDLPSFFNNPYWTSEYVHLGPYRISRFDSSEGMSFQAYDGYYLGRPKIDTIQVRIFGDPNALFANILAGEIDLFPQPTLIGELGTDLKNRWASSGEGHTAFITGTTWNLIPQWRPDYQKEPAVFHLRVRAALYHAIDRESLSEVINSGLKDRVAYSLFPLGDPFYEATKDGMRQYAYDPEKARTLLKEAGWSPGPDGTLRSAEDGRRFQTHLRTTPGENVSIVADYWRQVGVATEEQTLTAAQVRDLEYRVTYQGWEATSFAIDILGREPGSAANRWIGSRHGYQNPAGRQLLEQLYRTVDEGEQNRVMRQITDYMAAQLPQLLLYFNARIVGVRNNIQALDDLQWGRVETFSRNAYLWEVRETGS